MIRRTALYMASGLLALLLSGCAGKVQQPISINDGFWQNNTKVIGIAMTNVPNADTHLVGADCLLCIAVASGANSSLTTHIKTLPTTDVAKLDVMVAKLLEEKGFKVKVIKRPLVTKKLPDFSAKVENSPAKDFTGFKADGVDVLLVVDIQMLGAYRTYAAYVPTSDPQAIFNGRAYMVDLENNSYLWYKSVNQLKAADVAWDEPPSFPGLTKAYYEVVESGLTAMKEDFVKQTVLAKIQP